MDRPIPMCHHTGIAQARPHDHSGGTGPAGAASPVVNTGTLYA